MFQFIRYFALLVLTSILVSCASFSMTDVGKKSIHSELPREEKPQVAAEDSQALSKGNRAFAIDLYHTLPPTRNLFFSPYSISLALAMTYAGTRGETEQAMAEAMNFELQQARLHPAFNALDQQLATRKEQSGQGTDGKGFRLNIVNDLWGQVGYEFLPAYLDVLSANYGAGMRLVDFIKDAEGARLEINRYISEQTEQKIKDLIPPGALDEMTRLVLTNAIYFNAAWFFPFDEGSTETAPFTKLDGNQVDVQMMRQPGYKNQAYVAGDGYQAVALPYENTDLAMWLIIPDAGRFEQVELNLVTELELILANPGGASVMVSMPRFKVEDEFSLSEPLSKMGMEVAFDPGKADFSGINSDGDLFISDVVHKSFIKVDEAGTEAAAATAVIVSVTSMPVDVVDLIVDRPFIFLIYDQPTQTILFIGRVVDPMAQ